MSDLGEFAAMIAAIWQHEGRHAESPIAVGDLLDRVFPYSLARRRLGIDVSEDYEALMMRLLAEEEGFASVSPADAAELARATMIEKLPDLAVLQLLRGASVVLHIDEAALPSLAAPPAARGDDERWRQPADAVATASVPSSAPAPLCWHCNGTLPAGRSIKFCPHCGQDQRPPVCSACQEPLERGWKHCPECGARVAGSNAPP